MTVLQKRVAAAVRKFYAKAYPRKKIASVRHVYPRCYVVAQPAPLCIVVVQPWADAEPHLREWEANYGSTTLSGESFDPSLKVGDWCSMAYVAAVDGCGWQVAVKVVR